VPGVQAESVHRLRNPMVIEANGDTLAMKELVLVCIRGYLECVSSTNTEL
jgi:hypothetical protein